MHCVIVYVHVLCSQCSSRLRKASFVGKKGQFCSFCDRTVSGLVALMCGYTTQIVCEQQLCLWTALKQNFAKAIEFCDRKEKVVRLLSSIVDRDVCFKC